MTQPPTLTHNFLIELEAARHGLYSLALASAGTPAAAEGLLLQTARDHFAQYARESLTRPVDAMAKTLAAAKQSTPAAPAPQSTAVLAPEVPMPADVWARLAAAVQIDAARSANTKALNPDSVLLRPDPLLAPRKAAPRRDNEPFELTSPSRLISAAVLVLLAGLVVTAYILTRPAPSPAPAPAGPSHAKSPAPTTAPAATSTAGEHAP